MGRRTDVGVRAVRGLTNHRLPRDSAVPATVSRDTRPLPARAAQLAGAAGAGTLGGARLQKLFSDWLAGTRKGFTPNVGVAPPEG